MPFWIPPTIIVGAVAFAAKKLYDRLSEDSNSTANWTPPVKTTLDRNLERLAVELADEEGHKVAIMGQPGAGKSSLLKGMTRGKVRPLPIIGTQTDATDWSATKECALLSRYQQFAFADVPGYDTHSHPILAFRERFPFGSFDVFVLVLQGKIHAADQAVYQHMASAARPVLIARSFADGMTDNELNAARADILAALGANPQNAVLFFSNRTREGVAELFDAISKAATCAG